MSLELTVKNENEITLPRTLAASPLTLSEIGAIVVMACLDTLQENEDGLAARLRSEEMQTALKSLKERGVFAIAVEGKTVTIKLKLDAIGL